jgi:beta-lactamase regulating signal transducer with metallopeptidase domain
MTGYGLTPETIQRFSGSLLHFIWQGAAIALGASICLRLLHRRSAELRYAFAVAALALMFAAPVVTFVFYAETGAAALRLLQLTGKTLADAAPRASAAQAATTAAWTQWILMSWSVGVFAFTARLVAGWRLSHRLVQESDTLIPESIVRMFEDLKKQLKLSRPVQLLINTQIDTPMVVGCLRPAVLVPLSALTGLSQDQLAAVLAHELAHIRRHDFLINILQRCVESLLFYHPGVWWLSARIRMEREHCCDDVAVRTSGDRRIYVQALVELERKRQTVPALSVAATGGSLVERVHRILGLKTSTADWQSAAATLVFVLVWLVAGAWQSSNTLQATTPVLPTTAPVAVAVLPAITSPAPIAQSVNAIAAIITAQPQPVAEPQVASGTKSAIQGIVTRAGSSEPIAGATVAIMNAPFDPDALKSFLAFWAARGVTMQPPGPGESEEKFFQTFLDTLASRSISASLPENQLRIEQFRAENTAKHSTVTDANGRFTIKDIPAGKYNIAGGMEGFFPGPGDVVITDVESGKPAEVVVPLKAGAIMTGRVKNAAGKALSNVNVTAYAITYQNGKIFPEGESSQATDDRGDYRLFWLPPGDYVIVADPSRFAVPSSQGGPIIAAGAPPPQGRGAAAQVLSTPQFMRTFYPQALTTGDARIVTVKGGEQLSGMDITVQKGATYKISGDIHAIPSAALVIPTRGRGANANPTNAPQRIQGYMGIEFRDPSVIDMRSTTAGGTVPSAAQFTLIPAEDGFHATYEVPNVLPGEYYLVPRVLQSIPAGSGNFTINRIPVDIRDRDVTNLAMELFAGVGINGAATIDGHSPGNATVRVLLQADGNPSPTYQGIASRSVVAKAEDGTFLIPNVPPTRYRLELGPGLPTDLYLADVRQGAASVFDTGLEVGKEPPAPLQVVLRSGAGIVEGVVRDGAGKPVRDATVVVVPPDQRRANRALYKTATSDAAGRFTVRGITPGTYKVFSWQGISGGEFYNSRFLSKYEFRGKSINVTQGGTVTETLTLIDGI